MADNEEDIVIKVDVSELKSQLQVAQQELRNFNRQLGDLQTIAANASAGVAASIEKEIEKIGNQASEARAKIASLTAQLGAVGGTAGTVGGKTAEAAEGMSKLNFATAGVTREIIVLGHEALVGNFSRIPGSLLVLTERMGGLNLKALGTFGAVAAVVAVLGYLAVKAVEASNAIDKIGTGAEFENHIELTKKTIQGLVDQLDKLHGISRKEADEAVQAFATMEHGTRESIEAMVALLGQYMEATDKNVKEASTALIKGFSDSGVSAVEFVSKFRDVTQAELENARQADLSNNAFQVQAAKLSALKRELDEVNPRVREHSAGMFASFTNMMSYIGALGEGVTYEEQFNGILKDQNALWEENKKRIDAARDALSGKAKTPGDIFTQGQSAGKQENPNQYRIQDTLQNIGKIKAALEQAKTAGDQVNMTKFSADLERARQNLQDLQIGPVMQRAREEITRLEATWKGSRSSMEAAERNLWASYLGQVREGSAQYYEILTHMHRDQTQENKAIESEFHRHGQILIATARESISEIAADDTKSRAEQLRGAVDVWQALLNGDKLAADQRIAVARYLNTTLAAIHRQELADANAIARSNLQTQEQISKELISEKKANLDVDFALLKITSDEKVAEMKKLVQSEAALDIESLQNERAKLLTSSKEYNDYTNRIKLLQQKLNTDLAQLDRQHALESIQSWKSTLEPIQSAVSDMFLNMGQSGMTFGQTMKSIAGQMINAFLAARIKIEFDWLAGQAAMAFGSQDGAQKSLLAWVLTKTGITAADETASATEIATKTATAGTSMGISAAVATAEIMDWAAVAAAAAFASTAAIPIIGPELAPAAAAAAYGETAAWAATVGVPGLDVGAYDVPQDMLAYIHKGESVVPATFADGLRSGGFGGGGGNTINLSVNMSAVDASTGAKFLKAQIPNIAKALQHHLKYNPSHGS